MLSKFFNRVPRAGQPLASHGMAGGFAGMDNAWATINGAGCHVQWSNGTPTIVIDSEIGDLGGWALGGDYLACYGESIGAFSGVGSATSVIDLINRELEGGAWAVTDDTDIFGGAPLTIQDGAFNIAGGLRVDRGLGVIDGDTGGLFPVARFAAYNAGSPSTTDYIDFHAGVDAFWSMKAVSPVLGTATINDIGGGFTHELDGNTTSISADGGSNGVYTDLDIVAVGNIRTNAVFQVGTVHGVTGTFEDHNGNTVQVTGGIITNLTV
jgi:hypothetical protein